MESLKLFWSDKQFPLKGPFWSDEINEKEVNRVLDYCLKSSDDEWQKSAESIMPSLIFFDNDNSSFKKLINN